MFLLRDPLLPNWVRFSLAFQLTCGTHVLRARHSAGMEWQLTLEHETAMYVTPIWNLDPTRILTRRELASVLADAKRPTGRS